ncbi:unnamed protein product [Peniophora sp. CBMAI 1063]|nr:unnamed protein product [Peniophora sp. CBMAI 1063]
MSLPEYLRESVHRAFSAKYLLDLVNTMRSASLDSQKRTVTACTDLLLNLGAPFPPKPYNPYLQRLLMSESLARGLGNAVASAMLSDIGMDDIQAASSLLYVIVILGDKTWGDDGRAGVDRVLRSGLRSKLEPFTHPTNQTTIPLGKDET